GVLVLGLFAREDLHYLKQCDERHGAERKDEARVSPHLLDPERGERLEGGCLQDRLTRPEDADGDGEDGALNDQDKDRKSTAGEQARQKAHGDVTSAC